MVRKRRRAARGDDGSIGQVFELLAELARERPAVGVGVWAMIFIIGVFLFWGDAHRWGGAGPMVGVLLLVIGGFGSAIALAHLVRHKLQARQSASDLPVAPNATVPAEHEASLGAPVQSSPVVQPRDGQAFERFVASHFRMQGYLVDEIGTHGRGGDRGVDLLMRRSEGPDTPRICVQCKDFAAWKVGAPDVRAFAGAVALRGPGHVGWIVTSGRFTADAIRDGEQLGIRLIDGEAWASMTRAVGTDGIGTPVPEQASPPPTGGDIPLCPNCRTMMVRRDPKAGGKQFRPFWGCRNYPACRATVETA